ARPGLRPGVDPGQRSGGRGRTADVVPGEELPVARGEAVEVPPARGGGGEGPGRARGAGDEERRGVAQPEDGEDLLDLAGQVRGADPQPGGDPPAADPREVPAQLVARSA